MSISKLRTSRKIKIWGPPFPTLSIILFSLKETQ
jgi:hypothetical protein